MIQTLDTLRDGRLLLRVQTSLAQHIQPGQSLSAAKSDYPVLRHNAAQNSIDCVAQSDKFSVSDLAISGKALTDLDCESSVRFVCYNDDIFRVLHCLYAMPTKQRQRMHVFAQFDRELPFAPCPSRHFHARCPAGVIAALPLLEDWGVFNRIAHTDAPGCYEGNVEELLTFFDIDALTIRCD